MKMIVQWHHVSPRHGQQRFTDRAQIRVLRGALPWLRRASPASAFACRTSGAAGEGWERAPLRKEDERSVAAQERELRDRRAGGLRRHEADTDDVDIILAHARPFQHVELQVCLLSGSKVDSSGL